MVARNSVRVWNRPDENAHLDDADFMKFIKKKYGGKDPARERPRNKEEESFGKFLRLAAGKTAEAT